MICPYKALEALNLGQTEKRVWPADPGAYCGRRARRAGAYEIFVPDEISERDFALDGDAVASVTEASRALQRLEAAPARVATLAALAQNLLRSGLAISASRDEMLRFGSSSVRCRNSR